MRSKSIWFSGFHSSAVTIVAAVLNLIYGILLANFLGAEGKGEFDLLLTTSLLVSFILGLSLNSGITFFVSKGNSAVGSLIYILFISALLQGSLALLIVKFLNSFSTSSLFLPTLLANDSVALIGIFVALYLFTGYISAILIGKGEFVISNIGLLISRFFNVVFVPIFIFIFISLNIEVTILLIFQVYTASLLITLVFYIIRLRGSFLPGSTNFRLILAFSLPCFLGNFVQFINYRLDIYFINYYHSPQQIGLYTVAVSLAQTVWFISNGFAMVILPKIASGEKKAEDIAFINRVVFALSAIASLFLAAVAYPTLRYVYGIDFTDSLLPLYILIPGVLMFTSVNVLASFIIGVGKPKINLNISIFGMLLTVIMNFLLVPTFSIVGAAIASLFSYSASAALTISYFSKTSSTPLRRILIINREDIFQIKNVLLGIRL